MQKHTKLSSTLIAASAAMMMGAGAQAQAIHVVINGTPLTFTGTPPREVRGSVLVPMRGVFEALGASVKFDKVSQTIYGLKGATNIILPLGALTATVNGQPQTLPQPAQLINGTTLVPLRFVSQALGATPLWEPATRTVSITTAGVASGAGFGPLSGPVTGVYPNTSPVQITLMANGQNTAVPISPATIILRSATGQPGIQVALSQIKPGDQVTVQRNADGTASVVAASYGEASGTVVNVDTFTQDSTGPLKAGDVLTASLAGTPGGKATFAIPGVVNHVAMAETSPGVYTGSFPIPHGISVPHAAVVGQLTVNGVTSTLIQAAGTVAIDSEPPRVTDFGPARGTAVESEHPVIYGSLIDAGSGINPNATRISVDGHDVTGSATVTPTLFTYKPESALGNGAHTVRVSVADMAGNPAAAEWTFQVTASKLIKSFTTNEPAGQPIGTGSTITFTLNAQPGGKASVSLGSLVKNLPLGETDPGVYVGEYAVRPGDTVENAPVTSKFTAQDGTVVTTSLPVNITIAAGPPALPKITSPENNVSVDTSQPLSVEGTAAPGSTVRVTVDYVSKALGGLFPVGGSTGSKDTVTDKNGKWHVDGLSLSTQVLLGRDTQFTVSAVTLDASGTASDAAKITLKPG